MKQRNEEMTWLGDDDALEEVTNLAGTIVGAAVGLAAGPIGVVAGAVVGSAVGSLAGMAMYRNERAHDAVDRMLDEEIGVYDGDLGRGESWHDLDRDLGAPAETKPPA